jgi:hypothetical protein
MMEDHANYNGATVNRRLVITHKFKVSKREIDTLWRLPVPLIYTVTSEDWRM